MGKAFPVFLLLTALAIGGYAYYRVMSSRQISLNAEADMRRAEIAKLSEAILSKNIEIEKLKSSVDTLQAQNHIQDQIVVELKHQLYAHQQTKPEVQVITEIESATEFNSLYPTTPLIQGDIGYAITPSALPLVVQDIRLGKEMVPWLEQSNERLKDIVAVQDKSLSEKNIIISQKDLIIKASDERFEMSNQRWETERELNANLQQQLKIQKKRTAMMIAGAIIVGGAVGYAAGR